MSIKSAILLSAALCLGVMTSALAQTTGSSGSSTGTNDTGYDSARTGNGVSDSYGNTQDTKAIPSADDAYGSSKKKNHGNDVGTESDLDQNGTGTAPGTDSFAPGSTGTSGDSEKYDSSKTSKTTTTTHSSSRYGRTGTSGKHGGAHDGGTSGKKDGGM